MTKHLPSVVGGIVSALSVTVAGALGAEFWLMCIVAGFGGFVGSYLAQKLGG